MNDREMTALIERAGAGLTPEVGDLVAGGAARGRARLRRRRAGAALVAAAVVGVVGTSVFAAQVHPGSGGTTVQDPAGGSSDRATRSPTPSAPNPAGRGGRSGADATLALDPEGIRAEVASMLPAGEVGPILREPPYPVVSTAQERILHFRYQGALTSFIIEPAADLATCEESGPGCTTVDGTQVLSWGPTTADQVTAQGVSVWQQGYVVSVLSYNAAEGKDVAPLTPQPPINEATLTRIAMSGAWFS